MVLTADGGHFAVAAMFAGVDEKAAAGARLHQVGDGRFGLGAEFVLKRCADRRLRATSGPSGQRGAM